MFQKRKVPSQKSKVILSNVHEEMVYDAEKGVGFVAQQDITDEYKDGLRDERAESTRSRERNFMKVGSVPVIFVNKWRREGFDIFDKNVTFADISKKCREEGCDDFISTSKRF